MPALNASSQPIAFDAPADAYADVQMASGSLTSPASGPFNPASYTRHFLMGSPIAFRPGSFGSRFYPGCSPGTLLGPLDPTDFKCGKMSTSMESDRGSLRNALSAMEQQTDEHCRNYQCCGLTLTDLHALVDHFETCHVVVPYAPFANPAYPNVPSLKIPHSAGPSPQTSPASGTPTSAYLRAPAPAAPAHQQYHPCAFDPDDMELDAEAEADADGDSGPSSGASTPPETPISTPISSYPSPTLAHAVAAAAALPSDADFEAAQAQQQQGAERLPPVSAFDTHILAGRSPFSAGFPPARRGGAHGAVAAHALGFGSMGLGFGPFGAHAASVDAFNGYAGYADFSSAMPGAVASPGAEDPAGDGAAGGAASGAASPYGVPPALLFSPSGTPAGSRGGSPQPGAGGSYFAAAAAYANGGASGSATPHTPTSPTTPTAHGAAPSAGASTSGAGASGSTGPRPSTTLSRPASSLLLSKPFKCPKPNCNKSYKQANGLKYHVTHGSCNFAPPKEVEEVNAVLASRHRARQAAAAANGEVAAEGEEDRGPLTVESLESMSEGELREVEREAEMRLKPFACGIGECQRRYKNMNGLRYHYQHSGDHGAIGLGLLASGQHECLRNGHNRSHAARAASASSASTPSASSSTSASGASTPTSTPGTPTTGHAPNGAPQNGSSAQQGQAQTYALHPQQAFAFLSAAQAQAQGLLSAPGQHMLSPHAHAHQQQHGSNGSPQQQQQAPPHRYSSAPFAPSGLGMSMMSGPGVAGPAAVPGAGVAGFAYGAAPARG